MKNKKEAVSSLNVVICVVRYISNRFSLYKSQCFKVIRNKASISSLGYLCVKNRLSAVLPKEAADHVLHEGKMAAVPSDVYSHIYSFLLQNKLVKTAKSFKKETTVVS